MIASLDGASLVRADAIFNPDSVVIIAVVIVIVVNVLISPVEIVLDDGPISFSFSSDGGLGDGFPF